MYKQRFLWAYYEFYDYIYGVCTTLYPNEKETAKKTAISCMRRIYTEMGDAEKEEIMRFVNKMMIEMTERRWHAEQEEKRQQRFQNQQNG